MLLTLFEYVLSFMERPAKNREFRMFTTSYIVSQDDLTRYGGWNSSKYSPSSSLCQPHYLTSSAVHGPLFPSLSHPLLLLLLLKTTTARSGRITTYSFTSLRQRINIYTLMQRRRGGRIRHILCKERWLLRFSMYFFYSR